MRKNAKLILILLVALFTVAVFVAVEGYGAWYDSQRAEQTAVLQQ